MKTPEQIALEHQRERLTKRFHKACADYGLIADGDHILIGLSGGKDSLLLTELLGRRARIYKPRFTVTALYGSKSATIRPTSVIWSISVQKRVYRLWCGIRR